MVLIFDAAANADAAAIAALRTAAAARLTHDYGHGHWSTETTEKGVLRVLATSRVLVARKGGEVVGTLRLTTKKPWAIDPRYFKVVGKPIYLLDMAVTPELQRRGIGRRLLEEAKTAVRDWPADAVRLDAYDADAGAAGFYAKCGFREVGRVRYRKVPLVYFELLIDRG